MRLALLLNRWLIVTYVLLTPVTLFLLSLSTPDVPSEQWLILEAFFIPFGVVLSADTFLGRYERGEMELLLARRSARQLFLILVLPSTVLLLVSSAALSLTIPAGGPLEAVARSLLLLGTTHLLLTLSRSRWFGLALFGILWLIGFTYMVPWTESAPYIALIWHPMRLSGGGEISPGFDGVILTVGITLLTSAWLAAGRDERWLR